MKELLSLISFGLIPLYKKHYSFYQIIEEFRNKLPRKQNEAKYMNELELENNLILKNISKGMTVVDVSVEKVNLSEADIDLFYNKLNNFHFDFILFKKYYKQIVNNLNRFNPKAENKNFDIVIVKELLTEDINHPLRPIPILIYHIKSKLLLTSWYFRWKNKK